MARLNAMVRGGGRGVFVPTNLSALWNSLQGVLHEMDESSSVAVEGSFLHSLFNGLVKEGEILGSLRAGVHWTPTVCNHAFLMDEVVIIRNTSLCLFRLCRFLPRLRRSV